MADILSDELLKRIAESQNSRCYGHEGRSMAAELIKYRTAAKEAAAKAAAQPAVPFPYGPLVP